MCCPNYKSSSSLFLALLKNDLSRVIEMFRVDSYQIKDEKLSYIKIYDSSFYELLRYVEISAATNYTVEQPRLFIYNWHMKLYLHCKKEK
jgi:hypothetical protein